MLVKTVGQWSVAGRLLPDANAYIVESRYCFGKQKNMAVVSALIHFGVGWFPLFAQQLKQN